MSGLNGARKSATGGVTGRLVQSVPGADDLPPHGVVIFAPPPADPDGGMRMLRFVVLYGVAKAAAIALLLWWCGR